MSSEWVELGSEDQPCPVMSALSSEHSQTVTSTAS
jgi:hypothetical protein